jgi:NADH-quinone oxidoreductase subunit J
MVGFIILAILALGGAIGVVVAKEPVHSALFLILNILALAIFYIVLKAVFLGVAQVIVYAGAIMVLFLFVVTLLTAGKEDSDPPEELSGQRWVAGVLSVLLGGTLVVLGIVYPAKAVPAALPKDFGNLHGLGHALWGPDFIYLILVAVMLLTAAVGVLVLNRPARRAARAKVREG